MNLRPLKLALTANAIFSILTGTLLAFWSHEVSGLFGPQQPMTFSAVGIALLGFAALLLIVARRPNPLMALAIIGADAAWILKTFALLAFTWESWTLAGVIAVTIVNALVGTIALFQALGVLSAFSLGSSGEWMRICIRIPTTSKAAALWPLISDLGSIHRYAKDITESVILSQDDRGLGAERTCSNRKGQRWSEEVIEWREGESIALRFLSDRPDFPFPFTKMRGGWNLADTSAGCDVEVWWEFIPRRRCAMVLLLPLMSHLARKQFAGVVAAMVARANGSSSIATSPSLIPVFC